MLITPQKLALSALYSGLYSKAGRGLPKRSGSTEQTNVAVYHYIFLRVLNIGI